MTVLRSDILLVYFKFKRARFCGCFVLCHLKKVLPSRGWGGGLAAQCAIVWGGLGQPQSSSPSAFGDRSRETVAVVVLESQLKKMVSKYKYRDLTVCETVSVLLSYKDFKLVLESYVFNDGRSRELMNLIGTIPVPYRGNTYNIPMCLWLLDTDPYNPPVCFVKPASSMTSKTRKRLDANGQIYLPDPHE